MQVTFATRSAFPERPNEDFAAATSTLAVLLDGAGYSDDPAGPCTHDAHWFTRALGARLLVELGAEPPVWIAEGVARAIDGVIADHCATCRIDVATHPSSTVAVLRELPDVLEYYVLGDSTIVFDLTGEQPTVRSDKRSSRVAVAERERVFATRRGTAEHESALVDLAAAEGASRNVRDGYWIASTNPDAAARARQGHVSRGRVRRAALLSDGAAAAIDRYGLMNWTQALDLIQADGPSQLIRQVRKAELSDEQ